MIINSLEVTLAAWSLLMSRRQDFLNSHLMRVLVTPNQEASMPMRDRVLSSAGAQDVKTSGYQAPDLDEVQFYRNNYWLDVDAVFRPGIDTPFSPTTFDNLQMGGSAENRILLDEEEDKENSLPPTRTPVSQRLTQNLVLMESRTFGTRIEIVSDYVQRDLFE